MFKNKLKLNDSKTEFVILRTPAGLKKVNTSSIQVGNQTIDACPSVHIGAFQDQHLKMDIQALKHAKVHGLIYTILAGSNIISLLTK